MQLALFSNKPVWTGLAPVLQGEGHRPPLIPCPRVQVLLRPSFSQDQAVTSPRCWVLSPAWASLLRRRWRQIPGPLAKCWHWGATDCLTRKRGTGLFPLTTLSWGKGERLLFFLYSAKCTGLGSSQTWVQVSILPLSSYLPLGQLPASLQFCFASAEWGQMPTLQGCYDD